MRHLFLATAMIAAGLAITLGAASVLQYVAGHRKQGGYGDTFEVNEVPKFAAKAAKQDRP